VAEPPEGAHVDPERAAAALDEALWRNVEPLLDMPVGQLLQHRYERYRYVDSLIRAQPHFGPKVESKAEPKKAGSL